MKNQRLRPSWGAFSAFFQSLLRQRWNDSRGSAERECKSFRPRIEKLDLELPIGNRPGLPDQQIEPLLGDRSHALLVDIDPASPTRRLAIDQHAKPHGRPQCGRTHDKMKIASVEAMGDAAVGLVQRCPLFAYPPIARKS